MEHVDAASLSDLPTRIKYLRKFIDFTKDDAAVLHIAKPVVAPLVPVIVDAVYVKLSSFDITWKSFLPRNTGYEGETPASLTDLTPDHAQIKFRKDFLTNYLVKLVTMDYDQDSSWEYLNKVGLMHTGDSGFAHRYEIQRSPPTLRLLRRVNPQGKETRSQGGVHPLRNPPRSRTRHHPERRSYPP